MAKQFVYDEDGTGISVWAEEYEQTIEKATAALNDSDVSLSDKEINDRIRVIPSPTRIKSSTEDVLMDMCQRGGKEAVKRVEDGMTLGLGTGSTTAWAIAAIGWKLDDGELENVQGAATSLQSHELAKEAGIPLVTVDQIETFDLAIDGADQWDPDHPHVIKGGGAAHAREKLIDSMADRLVIATDEQKIATPLDHDIPLSVLPESRDVAQRRVREQNDIPALRYADQKDGPLFTANGNLVIDCDFGTVEKPEKWAETLARIPGVQEHGLFVDMVDEVVYGTDEDVESVRF